MAVVDNKLGPINAVPFGLATGETRFFTETTDITETMTNTVTVTGQPPFGAGCVAEDTAAVTVEVPPASCADGKPSELVLVYSGETCAASNNSQSGKKTKCEGDPAGATPVQILASDKSNPSDGKAKVWFDGLVDLNNAFSIKASNTGQSHFSADTYLHVGASLQLIKMHTSCSVPLNAGDQFGSIVVDQFIPE